MTMALGVRALGKGGGKLNGRVCSGHGDDDNAAADGGAEMMRDNTENDNAIGEG